MERAELGSPLSVFWILWKWTFVLFWAMSLNGPASLRRSFRGWPISSGTNSFSLAVAGYWLGWQWLDRGQGKVLGPCALHSILKWLVSQHFSLIIIFLSHILEKKTFWKLCCNSSRENGWKITDQWSFLPGISSSVSSWSSEKCINYKALGWPATGRLWTGSCFSTRSIICWIPLHRLFPILSGITLSLIVKYCPCK